MSGKSWSQRKKEELDREHLLGILRGKGPIGYNELFEESHIGGKQTYANRMEELEEDGFVERGYEKPEGGRGHQIWRLSQKALDPVNKVIRRLNLTAGPNIKLDKEKGPELLSEDVIKFLLRLQTLKWEEEKRIKILSGGNFRKITEVEIKGTTKSWIISDKQVDKSVKELGFTEYDLLKGLASYYFETRFVKYHNKGEVELYKTFDEYAFEKYQRGEEEKRKAEKMSKQGPQVLLEFILLEDKENKQDRDFTFLEETLQDFHEKEENNPVFFPVKYACEERGFKNEMEELLKWLEPLLTPNFPDEPETDKETIEKLEKLGIPWGPPEPRLGNTDNLAGILFLREAQHHAEDKLRPAWVDYFSENRRGV